MQCLQTITYFITESVEISQLYNLQLTFPPKRKVESKDPEGGLMKIVILTLALVASMSVFACGEKDKTTSTDTDQTQTTTSSESGTQSTQSSEG